MGLSEKLRSVFKTEEKGPAQRAGEKIDRATQKAKANVERCVDKTGDKLIQAGKKLKNSLK